MDYDEIAEFWKKKGLTVRASNVLAKANIDNEERLLEQLTTFEEILFLRNCGRLTAREIWKFIDKLKEGGSQTQISFSYQKLSNRAKHVLKEHGVYNDQQLAAISLTKEQLSSLRNVGDKTSEEIWETREYLRSNQAHPEKTQHEDVLNTSKLLPLLQIQVPLAIWKVLCNIPFSQIDWNIRTKKGIIKKGCITIADLTQISGEEWLKTRNFGRGSLVELRKKLSEFIANTDIIRQFTDKTLEDFKYVCLLERYVPQHIWYALRLIPLHDVEWQNRTKNAILGRNCKTLADIASISADEWLQEKNVGRKSVTELEQKVSKVIDKLLSPDKTSEDNALTQHPQPQPPKFSEIGETMLSWLKEREQQVIKFYYGYEGASKTLEEIGERFGLTRERIRQIKEKANERLHHKTKKLYLSKSIFDLLGKKIPSILEEKGGIYGYDELFQTLSKRLEWGNEHEWLITWLNDVFGDAWILWGVRNCQIRDGVCQIIPLSPIQEFIINFANMLKNYGYRPVHFEDYVKLYQKKFDYPIERKQLRQFIINHPHLAVHEYYGEQYIGRKDWQWFAPSFKKVSHHKIADLVEWFLRLTNIPARAIEIAYGIREKVGPYDMTRDEIIEACELDSGRFIKDDQHRYHLTIWENASMYRSSIETILHEQPAHIMHILHKLSPENSEKAIAALHLHQDMFIETLPFEWALKEPETSLDLDNLTFEDLIPR